MPSDDEKMANDAIPVSDPQVDFQSFKEIEKRNKEHITQETLAAVKRKAEIEKRTRDIDAYTGTIDRLEPDITPIDLPAAAASIAISLKRIADVQNDILSAQKEMLRIHRETRDAWRAATKEDDAAT